MKNICTPSHHVANYIAILALRIFFAILATLIGYNSAIAEYQNRHYYFDLGSRTRDEFCQEVSRTVSAIQEMADIINPANKYPIMLKYAA